jgi:hypothetical protein
MNAVQVNTGRGHRLGYMWLIGAMKAMALAFGWRSAR